MATTRFIDHLLEGDHASRPAASAVPQGTLYSCTTHSLIYQSDGTSTWSTWATLGGTPSGSITSSGYDMNTARLLGRTTASSGAIEEITVGTGLSLSAGSLTATGGSTVDPITDQFGAATTTYDGTSLSGWTAFGSPDTNDADTTIQDSFYLADKNSSFQLAGNYRASPSTPFTLLCSMNVLARANYHQAGIFVGAATPGVISTIEVTWNGDSSLGRGPRVYRCTGPTDGSGTTVATIPNISQVGPCYLAIVVTSTSSVAYYISLNGYIWTKVASGHDPSTTVGSIGFLVSSGTENSIGCAVMFQTLYVYGSALTMPGA